MYIPYQYFEDCLLYWNAIDYLPAVPVVVSSRLHNLSLSLIKKESSETFEDKKGKRRKKRGSRQQTILSLTGLEATLLRSAVTAVTTPTVLLLTPMYYCTKD